VQASDTTASYKIRAPAVDLSSLCLPSVCPEGGASDRVQGHHREGVPASGYYQQAGPQPLQQTHRPGYGGVPQGGGAETERA